MAVNDRFGCAVPPTTDSMLDAVFECLSAAMLARFLPVDALDCNTWLHDKLGYDNALVEHENASVDNCEHDNAPIDEYG